MNAHIHQITPKSDETIGFRLRQWAIGWLLDGLHLRNVSFGENSITLSPAGVGDVARWSATQNAAAAGDLGMNVATGRPNYHDGVAVRDLVSSHLLMLLDGTQAMTGALDGGAQRITNIAAPTAATDAATAGYVDTRIAAQANGGGANAGLVGSATAVEINAATPALGDIYVAEDTTAAAAGVSDVPAIGDVLEFDGTSWLRIITQVGGLVPAGTRLIVATTTAFIGGGGLTTATDEGKIAIFDGAGLVPSSFTTPADGGIVAIASASSVNDARGFVFDGSVPTGVWTQAGGIGAAHGGLAGLLSDDHTQYALLAGRAGGQVIAGGTGAAETMTVNSTTHATKGSVSFGAGTLIVDEANGRVGMGGAPLTKVHFADLASGEEMRFGGATCGSLLPSTDNTGNLGSDTRRWNLIRGNVVRTGDLHLERVDDDGSQIAWKMREYGNGIRLTNQITGVEYDMPMRRRTNPVGRLLTFLGL